MAEPTNRRRERHNNPGIADGNPAREFSQDIADKFRENAILATQGKSGKYKKQLEFSLSKVDERTNPGMRGGLPHV